MPDIEKMLKEIKDSFTLAQEKFAGHDELIKGLQDNLDALERKVLAIAAQGKGGDEPLGFADEKVAKDFVTFARSVLLRDAAAKDMSEGVDADGGYLVPEEFQATLIRLMEVYGTIRKGATVVPMSRLEMNIPRLTSGVTVYWPDEGATIPNSTPQFGNLKMVAKKMAALVKVSSELMEDSSLAVANLIATLIAEAMAKEEDRVGFAGNSGGGDPFDGILYDSDVGALTMAGGETNFGNLNADYLADMIASLPSAASDGAKFYMHRTIFNVVRKLKDSTNNYIYAPPGGGQPGTVWGYPYELTDVLPSISDSAANTPFVVFGNLRHFYLGDRKKMSFAQSQHVGFAEDQVYLRAIERVSLNVGLPTAFVVLKTAAS